MKKTIPAIIVALALFNIAECYAEVNDAQFSGQPIELCGKNKKVEFSVSEKALAEKMLKATELIGDGKDLGKAKMAIDALSKIIEENPEYSDAYDLRATINLLILSSKDYSKILEDINNAIKFHSSNKYKSAYDSDGPMYSTRAKVNKQIGNYKQVLEDFEKAITLKPSANPGDVINVSGVKAEEALPTDMWSNKDFDEIINKFPSDYRGYLFRGYFYSFFTTFDEKYYALATKDYEEAIHLNPNSALSYYLLAEIYVKSAHWTKAVWADLSGQVSNGYNEKVIQALNKSIALDPQFKDAYIARAESHFSLKQFKSAVEDYNKIIDLDPNNDSAYNDRGLAKVNLGDYYGAISDFTSAIEKGKSEDYKDLHYKNRADAYVKVADWDNAIKDFSKAIQLSLGKYILLMNISQFRAIYPEYNKLTDEALAKMLWQKFYPEFKYEDFKKGFLIENKKGFSTTLITELYAGRGDAYLMSGHFRKAIAEYNRVINGFPDLAETIDRWRLFIQNQNSSGYIDIKTVEFSPSNTIKVWIKMVDSNPHQNNEAYSVQRYEIDCSTKMINPIEITNYDSSGNPIGTATNQKKQHIMPDTIGEALYNGLCVNK